MEEEYDDGTEFINPGDPGYDNPGPYDAQPESGGAGAPYSGPTIMNFDVDNPKHTAAQRARERFAYNEALGINGAGLTDQNLARAAAITQQMRDPNLSSRHVAQLHQELQGLDVGYSPQQIQRIQALNNQQGTLDESLAKGELTQEQYGAASNTLQTMIGAVKPQRIPQKKSPFPPGQGIGDQWTSPTGDLVTRDDKGSVKVLTKYPMTPEGLEEKYFFDAYNSALKLTHQDKDGEKRHLSPEEASKYATESLATWKKIQQQRRGTRGDAQAPVAEPGDQPSRARVLTQGAGQQQEAPVQLREAITKAMGGRKNIAEIKDPAERQRLVAMYQKLKQLETQ